MSSEEPELTVWDAEHLRLAVQAAGVALWSWNVDTDRLTLHERAYDLWGVPGLALAFWRRLHGRT